MQSQDYQYYLNTKIRNSIIGTCMFSYIWFVFLHTSTTGSTFRWLNHRFVLSHAVHGPGVWVHDNLHASQITLISRVSLPKGPYLPCVSIAGRALFAGYPRYVITRPVQCVIRVHILQTDLLTNQRMIEKLLYLMPLINKMYLLPLCLYS